MNRSKAKGTSFESAVVQWLHEQGQLDAERLALHGTADEGDIAHFAINGYSAIAECKNYSTWTKADLERWQAETKSERDARGTDVGVLVVHKKNCGVARFGQNHVFMTLADVCTVAECARSPHDLAVLDGIWLQFDLDTLGQLMHIADPIADLLGD